MDALEDTQSSLGVCCCCLAEGSYKDMMRPYTWIGQDEIYSTMLIDCFGIDITSLEVAPWLDSKRLICELCIARLREASSFKTQVEQAQKTYVDRLKTFNFRDITKPDLMAPAVKLEQLDDSEVDHYNDLVDDFAVDDDMSDILPAVTSRDSGPSQEERWRVVKRALDGERRGAKTRGVTRNPARRKVETAKILELIGAMPFRLSKSRYLCMYCTGTYPDVAALREHMPAHEALTSRCVVRKMPPNDPVKIEVSFLKCKLCEEAYDDFNTIRHHLTAEHNCDIKDGFVLPFRLDNIPFTCQVCSDVFYVFTLLNQHMNKHFQNYICSTCGKGYITKHRLKAHLITHSSRKFSCVRCGEVFPSYHKRNAHVGMVHKAGMLFSCPYCSVTFKNYHVRVRHMSQVHAIKVPVYNCRVCERVYMKQSALNAHVRSVHLGEKNYECSECGAKFFRAVELKNHVVKHGGERIFKCDICLKAYARIKTLREHMRIHLNDKRFVCQVCAKGFVQNCSLRAHLRVHHPDFKP